MLFRSLANIDPRLDKALNTSEEDIKGTAYHDFLEGKITLSDLYQTVIDQTEQGTFNGFSEQQKAGLRNDLYKGNIFAPRTYIASTFDPNKALPFDRIAPIRRGLVDTINTGEEGNMDSVFPAAVRGLEDVLYKMATSTVDPETGEFFKTTRDFVNSKEGNLLFENVSKDRKSTRLNSSHIPLSRMPSSA